MNPPPGYPFAGRLPSRPPAGVAGGALGLAGFMLAFAGSMAALGFLLVVVLVSQIGPPGTATPAARSRAVLETSAHATPGSGSDASLATSPLAEVVPPPRDVPVHPLRFLEGCGAADLDTLEAGLNAAIGRGAPLFNDGDSPACVAEYVDAATGLESGLAASCQGPRRALRDARSTSRSSGSATAGAWALRDTFDGLLDVIERSRMGGVGNL